MHMSSVQVFAKLAIILFKGVKCVLPMPILHAPGVLFSIILNLVYATYVTLHCNYA
jgi:hypothetical protein